MNKKTVLQEAKDFIVSVEEQKAATYSEISEKQAAVQEEIAEAEMALKKAIDELNVKDYEIALNAKNKAETVLSMYASKYDQLAKQEYISEEKSDEYLKALEDYENDLAAEFNENISGHLEALANLLDEYTENVKDVENTIKHWENVVHANYISHFTTFQDGTKRSPTAIPFHSFEYKGSSEAAKLREYLKKAQVLS